MINFKIRFRKIFMKPGASKKRFTRLVISQMRNMRLLSKTKMLIHQSKANLDEKFLFGKITYHLDPEC